ncbi:Peptidase C48, SUMO/Sentrin/Ubl1 [Ascosphaera apis ARSEF 7405]|uniref:Peptidase C48, SUMO/Sentrin/Ubl1 n=1 Tax=Ascosphaera apis ARSEF 7405 TaxID=392613 RepID=A0A167WBL8_9EURO|nr:Peptidase C48, SUMO/Sentrin/Ubl1 [Ascosphaera apis ARSEF 7405]
MSASSQIAPSAAEIVNHNDTINRSTSTSAPSKAPPNDIDGAEEGEEMMEIPVECSENPDRRVPFDNDVRHNENKITLEIQAGGQDRPHRTIRLSTKGKTTFYDHFDKFKQFHKVDFAEEVPSPKTTSDHFKYIYQSVGDAAPFKCKACTENGLFTTCVVYPFYSTKTVGRACVNCFIRRRAASCEHNPERTEPSTISQSREGSEEDVPLSHSVKAAPPAPTTISTEQIRALHALGLVIVPVETIPNTRAPQSQRQADEKCQKAVHLIHQHLADYRTAHKGEAPLLQVIGAPEQISASPAINNTSPPSAPKPSPKKKKLYKTGSELGKRQRPEIAFTMPSKKVKNSAATAADCGSPEVKVQKSLKTPKVAASSSKPTTTSVAAPVASGSVPTAIVPPVPSVLSQVSPTSEKKKDKEHKKEKKEKKDKKDKKRHKHHKKHHSRATAKDDEEAVEQAPSFEQPVSPAADVASVSQQSEALVICDSSAAGVSPIVGDLTGPPTINEASTKPAEDPTNDLQRPLDGVVTPVKPLTKRIPRSRPSSNIRENVPRCENRDGSPLKHITNSSDKSEMQRCDNPPVPCASSTAASIPLHEHSSITNGIIPITNQAQVGATMSTGSRKSKHNSLPAATVHLLSSSDHSDTSSSSSDDSDDESGASAATALKLFLPQHTEHSPHQSRSSYSPPKTSKHGIVYSNVVKGDFGDPAPWSAPIESILGPVPCDGIILAYSKGSLLPPAPHTPPGDPPLGRLDDSIHAQCEHELAERCAWSFPVVRGSKQYFSMAAQEHNILRGTDWYDDIIISCYMHLLHNAHSPRSQRLFGWIDSVLVNNILRRRMDEHFFPAEWSSCLKELREARFIIAPTNLHSHWVLVAFDKKTRSFVVGDSAVVSRSFNFARRLADPLLLFFRQHKVIPVLDGIDTWKYLGNPLPPQDTSYDCGPFVCAGAKLIWETGDISRKLSFTQKDVTAFRGQMLAELVIGKAVGFNPSVGIAATTVEHEQDRLKYSLSSSPSRSRASLSMPPPNRDIASSSQSSPSSQAVPVNRRLDFGSAVSAPNTPVPMKNKSKPLPSSPLKIATNIPLLRPSPASPAMPSSLPTAKENASPSTNRKVPSLRQPTTKQESSLTTESDSPPHLNQAQLNLLSSEMIDELDSLSGDKAESPISLVDDGDQGKRDNDSVGIDHSCDQVVDDYCTTAPNEDDTNSIRRIAKSQWTAVNTSTVNREPSPAFREVRWGIDPHSPTSKKHPFFKPATIKVAVKDTRPIDPNPEGLTPEERYAYENITPEEGRSMMTIPIHKFPMPEPPTTSSSSVDADKPIKQEPSADDNVLKSVPAENENYVVYQPKPRKAPKAPKTISSAWIVGVSKNWGRRKKAGPYEGVYRKQRKR